MIRLTSLAFAAIVPLAALAQSAVAPAAGAVEAAPVLHAPGSGTPAAPLSPEGVSLADFLWTARPLVVFAESPEDPNFHRQMQLLRDRPADLLDRQVVIIADTDPAAFSDLRRRLRPNGFAIVLIDTNGRVLLTRPTPRSVRELSAAIDKSPQRRQELQDRRSGGG